MAGLSGLAQNDRKRFVVASKTRTLALIRAFQWRELRADLVEKPELLAERDDSGRNWLHVCCSVNVQRRQLDARDSTKVAEVLLDAGIDINEPAFVEGDWKATALWYSIAFGPNIRLARFLLERGCDPNHCLWAAVNRDSSEAIEMLLQYGAEDPGDEDTSLFSAAIQWNSFGAAEALLKLGADVNFQDKDSMTALHYLLKKRSGIGPVKMLIDHGARGDIRDRNGVTAAQIMMRKRDPQFRKLGSQLALTDK